MNKTLWLPAMALAAGIGPALSGAQTPHTLAGLTAAQTRALQKGRIVHRIARGPGRGWTMEALVYVPAPVQQCVQLLLDFQHYRRFVPNLIAVEVLADQADLAIVNHEMKLPLGVRKRYRSAVTHFTAAQWAVVAWRKLEWAGLIPEQRLAQTLGYWFFVYEPDAQRTLVLYRAYTDPGLLPTGLGWIIDRLARQSVVKMIKAVRELLSSPLSPDD